jgi:hypothetical protein
VFGAFTGVLLLNLIFKVLTFAGVPNQWFRLPERRGDPRRADRPADPERKDRRVTERIRRSGAARAHITEAG